MRIVAVSDSPGGTLPGIIEGQPVASLREMLAMVGSRYGPVVRVGTYVGGGPVGAGALTGHAELLDMDGLLQDIYGQPSMDAGVNDTLFGGGKGFDFGRVTLSSLGEAVERAVGALVANSPNLPSDRPVLSWEEADRRGMNALHPDEVHLFSDSQYATPQFMYEPFTPSSQVQWVSGQRLISGEEVWVPSQLVDMVHIYHPGEAMIGYPVSGGLACHDSFTGAVYGGLTEVFERDAVNVSWYTGEPPQRVALDSYTKSILGPFAERLEIDHSRVAVLRHAGGLTSSHTFSIVAFQDWSPRMRYCAGGACDADPRAALRSAAVEFGQTRNSLSLCQVAPESFIGRGSREMFDWEPEWHLSRMKLFLQAIGYYGLPGRSELLDHYFSGPVISGEEAFGAEPAWMGATDADKLAFVAAELDSAGVDPIVLNYSHPDWRHLAVAKVFIPELTTPFLQSRPVLGHPRLQPLRDGIELGEGHLQPLPYP